MKASYVVELGVKLLEESFRILIRYKEQHGELPFVPCKVIRIPESRKFLLVEIGIPGVGIWNPAFGIQDPAFPFFPFFGFIKENIFVRTVAAGAA